MFFCDYPKKSPSGRRHPCRPQMSRLSPPVPSGRNRQMQINLHCSRLLRKFCFRRVTVHASAMQAEGLHRLFRPSFPGVRALPSPPDETGKCK